MDKSFQQQLRVGLKKNQAPTALDYKLYKCIQLLFIIMGHIPKPLTKIFGDLIGYLFFSLDSQHRKITLNNLKLAFSDLHNAGRRWKMARAVYRNLGQVIFEIGWSLIVSKKELYKRITIDGEYNLRKAYSKGKGLLILTAHIGNWEILPIVAAMVNIPINIVYRPLDFRPLNIFFEKLRDRFGAVLIPSRGAMKKIITAIGKGEVVVILMDQSASWYDGVWVDFFGHPACSSKGMARIALKTRCPVIPVFLYRKKEGFHVVIGKEIPLTISGDKTTDVETNTFNYIKVIESAIRQDPSQWFWVHNRWKSVRHR